MPFNKFITDAQLSLPQEFAEYIKYIYGDTCDIDSENENEAQFTMNVPGDLKREEFESDVQEWCDEHNCSFELINQTPEAPSPQFFSENMKLMYPRMKSYEKLAADERKFDVAKRLFKKSWNQEFDPENEDDREDIVLLYNEYMDELSEWKPIQLKLKFKEIEK